MRFLQIKFVSEDSSKLFNYTTKNYDVNGISVNYTIGDKFLAVENVNRGRYNVLTVSFSNKTLPIPTGIIEPCLIYFGFDTSKEYYVNTKTYSNYADGSMFTTIFYEQLTDRKV